MRGYIGDDDLAQLKHSDIQECIEDIGDNMMVLKTLLVLRLRCGGWDEVRSRTMEYTGQDWYGAVLLDMGGF